MGAAALVTRLIILIVMRDVVAGQTDAKKPKVEVDEPFKLLAEEALYKYWADHRQSGELHITEYVSALAEKRGSTYTKTVRFVVTGCDGNYNCNAKSEYDPYEDTDTMTVDCKLLQLN